MIDFCFDYFIMGMLDYNVFKSGIILICVFVKVGLLEDISDFIEDGKEFVGEVILGNIN